MKIKRSVAIFVISLVVIAFTGIASADEGQPFKLLWDSLNALTSRVSNLEQKLVSEISKLTTRTDELNTQQVALVEKNKQLEAVVNEDRARIDSLTTALAEIRTKSENLEKQQVDLSNKDSQLETDINGINASLEDLKNQHLSLAERVNKSELIFAEQQKTIDAMMIAVDEKITNLENEFTDSRSRLEVIKTEFDALNSIVNARFDLSEQKISAIQDLLTERMQFIESLSQLVFELKEKDNKQDSQLEEIINQISILKNELDAMKKLIDSMPIPVSSDTDNTVSMPNPIPPDQLPVPSQQIPVASETTAN